MKARANLFRTLLMLPVLLAVLLVASAPSLGQDDYYPLMVPSPQDQETGVYRDTSVRMYFLGPLDPTTVNTDTFKLVKQGTTTPVEATVSYFDWCEQEFGGIYYCAADLDPQADLGAQTTYTATVKGGENGVKWASGYPGPTLEDYSWSFTTGDTTRPPDPPETTITSGPCGPIYRDGDIYWLPCQPTTSTTATFAFTSSIANSTFECSLDSAAFTSCTSPKAYTGLSDGTHTFQVRATDASGNTDPTPAGRTWTVDTKAPSAPTITSPQNNTYDTDGSYSVSGNAEGGSTVELFEGTTSKGSTKADSSSGAWSIALSGLSEGAHTYTAKAKDAAGNTSSASNSVTVRVDTTKPMVKSTTPQSGATDVGRGNNLTATFSEKIRTSSVNTSTFKLYKLNPDGTQTQITDVVVSLSYDKLKATLNPFGTKTTLLARNTKYKGVISTGTKDLAGNSLAQQKSWTFTTKP
jgi:hypothetical protein